MKQSGEWSIHQVRTLQFNHLRKPRHRHAQGCALLSMFTNKDNYHRWRKEKTPRIDILDERDGSVSIDGSNRKSPSQRTCQGKRILHLIVPFEGQNFFSQWFVFEWNFIKFDKQLSEICKWHTFSFWGAVLICLFFPPYQV